VSHLFPDEVNKQEAENDADDDHGFANVGLAFGDDSQALRGALRVGHFVGGTRRRRAHRLGLLLDVVLERVQIEVRVHFHGEKMCEIIGGLNESRNT